MADEVRLTLSLNKDNVQPMQQPQLVYILMEITPTAVMASVQMPLNFCFVLDQSGSMEGEKIRSLKEAVKYAIDMLHPEDYVSIVTFENSPHRLVASQSARDRSGLKRKVDSIKAGGGTEIAPALRMGMEEVRKQAGPNRINRIVLLTDGQTENEEHCLREAEHARSQGIAVTALGLGDDWKEELLMEISTRSGGVADYVATPQQMAKYFQDAVQSMQNAVIQNATLTLRMSAGVMPRKVWRVVPLISDLGFQALSDRDVTAPLGELEKGQGQAILVELMMPPKAEGRYRIAQAEVSYDIPSLNLSGAKVRSDVVITYTSNPALYTPVNPKVMNIIEKVNAFKLQTRALSDAAAGNVAGATQKLRAAATILLNQGEGALSKTIQLEADRLEQQGEMSSEGKKTIRLGGGKTVKLSGE